MTQEPPAQGPPGGGAPPPGGPGAPPPGAPPPGGQGAPPPPGGQGAPGAGPSPMAQQPPVQDAGLQPPVANLLSYLFMGLGGLIIFLTQRDREVRFHGAQSMLLGIFLIVVYIALSILFSIVLFADPTGLLFGLFALLFSAVLPLAVLALGIYMCVQGYQQRHVKLPVIGGIAEGWAGGGAGAAPPPAR